MTEITTWTENASALRQLMQNNEHEFDTRSQEEVATDLYKGIADICEYVRRRKELVLPLDNGKYAFIHTASDDTTHFEITTHFPPERGYFPTDGVSERFVVHYPYGSAAPHYFVSFDIEGARNDRQFGQWDHSTRVSLSDPHDWNVIKSVSGAFNTYVEAFAQAELDLR